jgi:hypothetical protein
MKIQYCVFSNQRITTELEKARYLYYMRYHRNPSEARVSLGRKVIDKGFVQGHSYKVTCTRSQVQGPAYSDTCTTTRHFRNNSFISRRVVRAGDRDQHVISPIASPVRRLTVSLHLTCGRRRSRRCRSLVEDEDLVGVSGRATP